MLLFDDVFVNRVIDGDTIVVTIPNVPAILGYKIPVRLAGIQCPELKNKDGSINQKGVQARQFTESRIRTIGFVCLLNVKRGKYYRLVADVLIGDLCLNKELLKKGLAIVAKY